MGYRKLVQRDLELDETQLPTWRDTPRTSTPKRDTVLTVILRCQATYRWTVADIQIPARFVPGVLVVDVSLLLLSSAARPK